MFFPSANKSVPCTGARVIDKCERMYMLRISRPINRGKSLTDLKYVLCTREVSLETTLSHLFSNNFWQEAGLIATFLVVYLKGDCLKFIFSSFMVTLSFFKKILCLGGELQLDSSEESSRLDQGSKQKTKEDSWNVSIVFGLTLGKITETPWLMCTCLPLKQIGASCPP